MRHPLPPPPLCLPMAPQSGTRVHTLLGRARNWNPLAHATGNALHKGQPGAAARHQCVPFGAPEPPGPVLHFPASVVVSALQTLWSGNG